MRSSSLLKSLLVVFLWTLPCLSQDAADQRVQDWKRAAGLFGTYYQDLNTKYSFAGHEKEYLERWNKWRTEFVELRSGMQKRYGNSSDEIIKKFEGMTPPDGVTTYMRQIAGELFVVDVDAKQKEIAGWSVEAGDQAYTRWQNFATPDTTKKELKADYARRALNAYERAAEIDPSGSYVESINKAKQALSESEKQWKAALVDLKWPGHNAEFEGPGKPDALAKEALKLLASVESWSKPEYDDKHIPVAACITGKGWQVTKKNPLTEVPTQYSLDVFVAFRGTQDSEIAYAYNMVFYTKEEEGVKKEPPFRFVNSRQYAKYKMLMSNVPETADMPDRTDGSASEEPAESGDEAADGSSAGVFGMILRLVLGVLLVVAGLASLEDFANRKLPAMASVCSKLQGQRKALGMALLAAGIFCFLYTTILHFAPQADLLPQLAAIAIGLQLGHEALPAAAAGKVKGLVQPLLRHAELLGFASLGLGILHLFLGGVVLL